MTYLWVLFTIIALQVIYLFGPRTNITRSELPRWTPVELAAFAAGDLVAIGALCTLL